MPTTVPANPRFASAAERHVYEHLRTQLGEQDVIFARQRVTDHRKDHEVDFVLAIEGAGIACLEVKGGEVWHDGTDWWQRRRGTEYRIHPVRQVHDACYALRSFRSEEHTSELQSRGHLVCR